MFLSIFLGVIVILVIGFTVNNIRASHKKKTNSNDL